MDSTIAGELLDMATAIIWIGLSSELEDTARYVGLLLASMQGFSLQPGKKEE